MMDNDGKKVLESRRITLLELKMRKRKKKVSFYFRFEDEN